MSRELPLKVDDIASEPPLVAKPMMRIGEILGKMRELRLWAVPVVDDHHRLIGILSYRDILMRGAGRDTKVLTVMEPPYSVKSGTSLTETIARTVSWKARIVPVVDEKRRLLAIVTRRDILKCMLDYGIVPDAVAEDAMSSPPITIHQDESIARARWTMLKSGVSRLPVVDDDEKIVGVITLRDIVERLYNIRLTRRKGFEWIRSEEEFLAAPVRDFMSSPPIYTHRRATLREVVETLLHYQISGMPITERERVVGVISGLDVMKKYLEGLVQIRPLEAKVAEVLAKDPISKIQVEKLVNDYISSLSRMVNVIDVKLSIKEESKVEKEEGRKRYRVRIKLATDIGTFVAEGRGWELLTALRDALQVLEKRVKKEVGKRTLYLPPREEGAP